MSRAAIRRASFFAIALGSVGVLIGAVLLLYSASIAHNSTQTTGHIVSIEERSGFAYPVFSFVDAHGNSVTVHSNTGTGIEENPNPARVGDPVPVIYKNDNPANAWINSFMMRWGLGTGFLGFSLFWVIIGMIVAAFLRQRLQTTIQPA
jgi:hypothetical protein